MTSYLPFTPTKTPNQIDSHLSYLISLIPEDNVIYRFEHEIQYLPENTGPVLEIRAMSHFPLPDGTIPTTYIHVDPAKTDRSIYELLCVNREFGTPNAKH